MEREQQFPKLRNSWSFLVSDAMKESRQVSLGDREWQEYLQQFRFYITHSHLFDQEKEELQFPGLSREWSKRLLTLQSLHLGLEGRRHCVLTC